MIYGIEDPEDLAQAGWGTIISASGEVKEAISPLLNHRREQAGALQEFRYREFLDYKIGESKIAFLARHGEGPGPLRAGDFPYYLLIIGDPADIPFSFQYQLGSRHRVGRIHFDTVEEYERYARGVVDAEARGPSAKAMTIFVADNPGDSSMRILNEHLTRPLLQSLSNHNSGWSVEAVVGADATKARLCELFSRNSPPRLLFIAAHGEVWSSRSERQHMYQGSVICSDWPGLGDRTRVGRFAADDMPTTVDLGGMIVVFFGSHSAGTCWKDEVDSLKKDKSADASFVAPLAKHLLGREKGALAFIGHVNTGMDSSFYWQKAGSQIQAFDAAFRRLLAGRRAGSALECFSQRYAEISVDIITDGEAQADSNHPSADFLHLAARDAKQYVLIGDPASKLNF